jgi:hypothetical protein
MASHFSAIGFEAGAVDDLQGLAETLARRAERVDTPKGHYLRWRGAGGEEVWLQLDADGTVVGMNPHFTGRSSVRVGLTAVVRRASETFMDGAFRAWADPPDDDAGRGAYPFIFDTPDFGAYANLELPALAEAQIAAFAHQVWVFASPEAFRASQPGDAAVASWSFIPSGLFTADGAPVDPPDALAMLTGHVLRAERLHNSLTGAPFSWALVETIGGTYDLTIAPELLPDLPPIGGVVSGTAWLSGRLTFFSTLARPWLDRLFDGGR